MNKLIPITILIFASCCLTGFAQEIENVPALNIENELKHYMPLYLDIPGDMNVKKGFKEINIAAGYADYRDFNGVRGLIEYDFAPINKLGFEIEVPFVFVHNKYAVPASDPEELIIPEEGGALRSATALRVGFNYTLLTLPRAKTTFSAGYFNELETLPFKEFGDRRSGIPLFAANIYNPFLVVAKIWGERLHSMIYAGPAIKQEFENNNVKTQYRLNTIVSYRFGHGENESFAGVECNQSFGKDENAQMLLRPQVQLHLSEKWKIGIVTVIRIKSDAQINSGGFVRLIYSPSIKI